MELLTNKTLWETFNPSAEQLDVTVAKLVENEDVTFKKVYFTGRTFASGRKTRVCANVCYANKKSSKGVLLISPSDRATNYDELRNVAKSGFLAMSVDIDGRTEMGCGTMYPEEVSYCNAIEGKDMFFFGETVRESKLYEQALNCMRAITYLVEEESAQTISVVTVGNCSTLGAIVCAQDKRVTNGMIMFGRLNIDYPEEVVAVGDNATIAQQFAHEDRSQAWTMGLAPQSYAINIDIPIYVVNSANSHVVDIVDVSKAYNRVNEQSRLLIVPDMFDCLDMRYVKSAIAWCKGTNVNENYDLSYFMEGGDYFVKLETSAKLCDVAIWYCTNANSRAKHWVKAKLTQCEGGYVAKLDLYEANCTVLAFAQIADKITTSTTLLEIPIKGAQHLKTINSIVFTGEGNDDLITVCDLRAWMYTSAEARRKKGYLGIVGAQGDCLATFALADVSVKKTSSFAVTFDVCTTAQDTLTVAVVCNYGQTNDVYVAKAKLVGDGKWQRVTLEADDFFSNSSERSKTMPADQTAQLLVLKCDQTFLVNNIILV